jgi:NCAIR mutase (PurE)-related protein
VPNSSPRARPARRRAELKAGHYARYDVDRGRRTGAPEVILAEGKSLEHLLGLLRAMAEAGHGALVSRPTARQLRALRRAASEGLPLDFLALDRLVRLRGPLGAAHLRGAVAVLSAGTADVPVAEEAAAVLEALGARVLRSHDVGVAGIHRLERALRRIERHRPAVYIVLAGREGALPTVVAGLVHAPVIGVPTSVGYGRGGRGEAALLAMLQSCAPIAVVNIDAAVPAALLAVQLLARRRSEAPRR